VLKARDASLRGRRRNQPVFAKRIPRRLDRADPRLALHRSGGRRIQSISRPRGPHGALDRRPDRHDGQRGKAAMGELKSLESHYSMARPITSRYPSRLCASKKADFPLPSWSSSRNGAEYLPARPKTIIIERAQIASGVPGGSLKFACLNASL